MNNWRNRTYREIIIYNIEELEKRRARTKDREEKGRINRTIQALLSDLSDYERTSGTMLASLDDILRYFFEG